MNVTERRLDVLCVGEALVDLLPDRRGPLEEVESFRRAVGGAPANVAVGLARQSARVGFLGLVGADAFGRYLRQSLAAEGVDISGVYETPKARTGLTFISLSSTGERSFSSYRDPAADLLFALDHVEGSHALFAQARIVHLGSTALSRDPSRTATWRVVELAKKYGCLLSCDPNLRLHIWESPEAGLRAAHDLIACADIVKLSDDESALLYGTRDAHVVASHVLAAGPKVVAVTLGAQGAYLQGPSFAGHLPANTVSVVDTTGAGDGFCAGMLAALSPALATTTLETLSPAALHAVLQRANEVGAAVVSTLGATPGMPKLPPLRLHE